MSVVASSTDISIIPPPEAPNMTGKHVKNVNADLEVGVVSRMMEQPEHPAVVVMKTNEPPSEDNGSNNVSLVKPPTKLPSRHSRSRRGGALPSILALVVLLAMIIGGAIVGGMKFPSCQKTGKHPETEPSKQDILIKQPSSENGVTPQDHKEDNAALDAEVPPEDEQKNNELDPIINPNKEEGATDNKDHKNVPEDNGNDCRDMVDSFFVDGYGRLTCDVVRTQWRSESLCETVYEFCPQACGGCN